MSILKNILLQGSRKGVGEVVLYKLKGQQIMRSKASQVNNPRTSAQMSRRVKLANLVNFYRANREWMKKAFETKEQKQSDYNAFISRNFNSSPVYLTKDEANQGTTIIAPYVVTRGSLVPYSFTRVGSLIVSDLYVGGEIVLSNSTTIGELSTAIIANNENDREGDQLSVVILKQQQAGQMYYCTTKAFEMILDPTSSELVKDFLPIEYMTIQDGAIAFDGSQWAGGVVMCQSRTISGKTYVSTQSVECTQGAIFANYSMESHGAAAMSSYGNSGEVFLDADEAVSGGQSATTLAILGFKYDGANKAQGSFVGNLTVGKAFEITVSTTEGLEQADCVVLRGSSNVDLATFDLSALTVEGSKISGTIYNGANVASALSVVQVIWSGGSSTMTFTTVDPNNPNTPGGME